MPLPVIDNESNKRLLCLRKADAAYVSEYKRFVQYFEENNIPPVTNDGPRVKYITRENIDLYYSGHVAKIRCGADPREDRKRAAVLCRPLEEAHGTIQGSDPLHR